MRLIILTAALAALSLPAFAQQGLPPRNPPPQQQPPRQAPPPPQQPQQQQQQPQQQQDDSAPGMFACRTEQEVCFIGVVVGNNQVSVLYTNDPKAENLDSTPINAAGAPDLGRHMGRVVMLTGDYNPQSGLSRVEVIDVASPLLSFAIKSMLSNNEQEEPEPPPPPQRQPPRNPPPRR